MDDLDFLVGYDVHDASTKPQEPQDAIRSHVYNKLKSFSTHAESCDPMNWPFALMPKINMGTVDRVIRIVQVTPNIDQTLYIIIESTEIFTSQSIRKLS